MLGVCGPMGSQWTRSAGNVRFHVAGNRPEMSKVDAGRGRLRSGDTSICAAIILHLRCSLAAVNSDDLAGHKAGVVGCEELDDVRDVVNVTEATSRDRRGHGGRALLRTAGEVVQAFGDHRAGGYGVDADTLGGHFERSGTREAVHRMLAGTVQEKRLRYLARQRWRRG